MREIHIALAAAVLLALAGILVAAPKATNGTATLDAEVDIFDLTRRANDLPVESYPAH
jgi:hypothetical protein